MRVSKIDLDTENGWNTYTVAKEEFSHRLQLLLAVQYCTMEKVILPRIPLLRRYFTYLETKYQTIAEEHTMMYWSLSDHRLSMYRASIRRKCLVS